MNKVLILLIFINSMIFSLSLSGISVVGVGDVQTSQTFDNDENTTNEDVPNRIAIIDTTYGIITFELYEHLAPITTSNFINLSNNDFYDGILFHRVIDDFVIQTGDPNTRDNNPYNDGSGGSSQTIPLEIDPELTHVDGAVGMARSTDPNSASSQFYICDGPQHQLDGDYAVFGVVIEGIDVVRKIAQVETWGYKRPLLKDHPIEDVIMYSVFITINESEFHYEPPADNDDDWLFGDSFRIPGFTGVMIITGIIIAIFISKKNRKFNFGF